MVLHAFAHSIRHYTTEIRSLQLLITLGRRVSSDGHVCVHPVERLIPDGLDLQRVRRDVPRTREGHKTDWYPCAQYIRQHLSEFAASSWMATKTLVN